jgi:hypothetical protein
LVENAVVSGPGVNRYGSPFAGAAHVTVEGMADTVGELSIALSMFGISGIAVSVVTQYRKAVHR